MTKKKRDFWYISPNYPKEKLKELRPDWIEEAYNELLRDKIEKRIGQKAK